MKKIQARIQCLLKELQAGIYEKEKEINLSLLAAIAGESVLLLGPPGVAKSMIARRLKSAFKGAKSFEYLMSRFSTPDELFGPVSITRLKENDCYERATDGYLPKADVVFLDEIWKAGPAIQNTLLTVMNEKLFRNGEKEERVPLKLLIAASNELPAKGEELDALWDRFLIRIVCGCIHEEETFRKMLTETDNALSSMKNKEVTHAILPKEYELWHTEARKLPLSQPLLEAISFVRKRLQHVEIEDSEVFRRIYISDRRWWHIGSLLRTSAYIHERNEAREDDLWPLYHCLWNEPDEIEQVRRITLLAIFSPYESRLTHLSEAVKADLRVCSAESALQKARREHDHRDDNLAIVNRFFYQIENHGTGNTFIFITDYKLLPNKSTAEESNAPARGIIYADPTNSRYRIVRRFSPDWECKLSTKDRENVTLARGIGCIYINGVKYNMRKKGSAVLNPAEGHVEGNNMQLFPNTDKMIEGSFILDSSNKKTEESLFTPVTSLHYEEEVESIATYFQTLCDRLKSNMFASSDDCQYVDNYMKGIYKQIAFIRSDIRRLLYNEE